MRVREEPVKALVDQCDLATAEAFARRLTPLHTVSADAASGAAASTSPGHPDFMDLLGLGDVHTFDPASRLAPAPGPRPAAGADRHRRRRAAWSTSTSRSPPSRAWARTAWCIGATGSGKSEFLRTLVLGLAMTHSPEQLNMVLVDFKGGATFAGMSDMPHVSAVITNLAQELTLVDRMQDALSGEMVRRQELLREAGNFASIRDYEKARAAGEDLAPMPSLFIVVDEFSEMLSAKPEFIDLFVAIGRLGRSLGLHLLLASQRLEEGRLRGLESHLSYRVGLRTFSRRRVPRRARRPRRLRAAAGPRPRLPQARPVDAAAVQGGVRLRTAAAVVPGSRRDEGGHVRGILPFTISEVLALEPRRDRRRPWLRLPVQQQGEQPSLLDIAVEPDGRPRPAAHQVWLPPLDVPDTLDELMGDLAEDPELGLVSPQWRGLGGLVVPLGTVDRPREQRRDTLTVNLAGAGGHVAVVGGPRSGKSTLLRTIVTSMSLTTTPAGVAVLRARLRRRHVRAAGPAARTSPGVGTRSEPDVVRRIDRRGARASSTAARPTSASRASTRSRPTAPAARRAAPTTATATCSSSSTAGARCAPTSTTSRWSSSSSPAAASPSACTSSPPSPAGPTSAPRCATSSAPGSSCGSATRSTPRSTARSPRWCPTGRPGRGLVPSKLHFLGALPRIDGDPDAATARRRRRRPRSTRVDAAWTGPARPQAAAAARADHPRAVRDAGRGAASSPSKRLLLGINEKELAPVGLDVDAEPHLLVFGDGQSGKSALLRAYVQEIMRTRTPKEAQIVVVDYRRSLLGEVPEEYLLNYLTSATQATPALQGPRGLPREPDPRPRRHARAAAQPVVVDRRRGVRASSTTTTWSPPSRARRCRRSSR